MNCSLTSTDAHKCDVGVFVGLVANVVAKEVGVVGNDALRLAFTELVDEREAVGIHTVRAILVLTETRRRECVHV